MGICTQLEPCKVDLYHQLDHYVSWRLDPGARGTNVFHFSLKDLEGYAFPPFSLIGKCLQKVRQEQNTIVLVAPLWQNQTWYPMLLELMVELPLLLPDQDILRDPMKPASSIGMPQQTKTSCLESHQQQHSITGVSEETSELLLQRNKHGLPVWMEAMECTGLEIQHYWQVNICCIVLPPFSVAWIPLQYSGTTWSTHAYRIETLAPHTPLTSKKMFRCQLCSTHYTGNNC